LKKGKYNMDYPTKKFIDLAKSGNRQAMYELGLTYYVLKKKTRGLYWLYHAARKGHVRAKIILQKLKQNPNSPPHRFPPSTPSACASPTCHSPFLTRRPAA
jgi:hypothetical protein